MASYGVRAFCFAVDIFKSFSLSNLGGRLAVVGCDDTLYRERVGSVRYRPMHRKGRRKDQGVIRHLWVPGLRMEAPSV